MKTYYLSQICCRPTTSPENEDVDTAATLLAGVESPETEPSTSEH